MLIESAFSILPETVAGYGFQKVKREANAVGSFSFSLLNALHSKNIVDPIQRIQMEKNFASATVPLPPNGTNRHCDIFLDYGGSKIGSKALSNYGWRYRNYVEAKFLKSYKKTRTGKDTCASSNSAEIVADLIRLVSLPPEPDAYNNNKNPKTSSARYFLCLSDNPPQIFINQYLKDLHSTFLSPPKTATISLDLTSGKAAKAFANKVGTGFNNLKLNIKHCTCFAHYPIDPTSQDSIWMLLMRIDAASIELTTTTSTHGFEISCDRTITQNSPRDYSIIRDFVAINLK